ncbi:MAG TPA: DUF4129 domain-containing protein [Chthonomonadaceae bacterium]|nr:DUF4129 domain-containing protein [Chthonomonadaceae bacterium]
MRSWIWKLSSPALLLAAGLCLEVRVLAQAPATPPDPAEIRARLDRILSSPEFQPPAPARNPLEGILRWLGEKWEALWKAIGDFLKPFFKVAAASGGSFYLQWLFIGLFILLGAWLLSKLIRQYLRYRSEIGDPMHTAYTHEDFEAEKVVEPDVWLQQAQKYASEGDYRRAFRAVFLAILLHLDRAGAIQYDRARTNGDYLRALRGQRSRGLYEAMLPLSAEFDRRWYGHRATTETDYLRCLREYERVRELIREAASQGQGGAPALAAGRG